MSRAIGSSSSSNDRSKKSRESKHWSIFSTSGLKRGSPGRYSPVRRDLAMGKDPGKEKSIRSIDLSVHTLNSTHKSPAQPAGHRRASMAKKLYSLIGQG